MNQTALSLYQLMDKAKAAIKAAFQEYYWILAEVSEAKVNYAGHCYLELIDKEKGTDVIKARVRATIWAATYRILQPYFETATNVKFRSGIKVLVKVSLEFHEIYGFSLNILDIEPSYTIGEAARQRQEVINRLTSEGVYGMNKKLSIPDVPKRIAVISSGTAAGYGDFMDQLRNNPYGYSFNVKLFPAIMQGEGTEQSVTGALDKVFSYEAFFDVVVLIRGGGSQSELGCFNNYWMAYHICQFPLPVLTGIGHEQDETVADLVAHTKLKTPTAVAEFLISLFHKADSKVNELTESVNSAIRGRLEYEKNILEKYFLVLKPAVNETFLRQNNMIHNFSMRMADSSRQLISKQNIRIGKKAGLLRTCSGQIIMNQKHDHRRYGSDLVNLCRTLLASEKHKLEIHQGKNDYLDPFRILARGYSVTSYKGKAITSSEGLPEGAELDTRLHRGNIKSKTI